MSVLLGSRYTVYEKILNHRINKLPETSILEGENVSEKATAIRLLNV